MRFLNMRSKSFITAIVLSSIFVGFWTGRYTNKLYYSFAHDVHASHEIRYYIHALNLLHDGKQTEAISYLNANLEEALTYPLGNYLENGSLTHPTIMAALREARDFRKKYPPEPRPTFRGGQEQVLFSIK